MTNHHPTKAELRASFKNISDTPDRLQHEYDMTREAKRLDIPVDEYRRYYDLRGHESFIEELPKTKLNDRVMWWVKQLSWKFIVKHRSTIGAIAGALPVITGAAQYVSEGQQRTKQAQYQAWQIINSAKVEESSSAGRILALQDLVKYDVNLARVDVRNAHLVGIQLSNAKLNEAQLNNVNFNKAKLNNANLAGAKLIFAKFSGADLDGANLTGADLGYAKLDGAKNINPEQIKTANNWEDACYDSDFRRKLKLPQNPKCDK
jgi:BTB/POZ domain-containing protein KCTD9